MILNILQHTPVRIWILLCALLALGFAQTRPRQVSRARATILPVAFVGLSLVGVWSAFGATPLAYLAWGVGFGAAAMLAAGAMAVRGATVAAPGKLQLPGSWSPLVLIVSLFVTKYGVGVWSALRPDSVQDTTFVSVASLVYGIFAGLFWARALSLRALLRGSVPARPA